MGVFSPINATFGVRADQLLESDADFQRYHGKLNRKLQKLRSRLHLTTRDTKKYALREKYTKITANEYDKKNKLFGVLMLLHAERDLALCEVYKLRSRQRNKLKKSEAKVVATRLKKAVKTSQRLVELTHNEAQWITRSQFLVYAKLAKIEYLLYAKKSKHKDSEEISRQLSLVFAALNRLKSEGHLPEELYESIRQKYEYTLTQHAGNLLTSNELSKFINTAVLQNKDDELVALLLANDYTVEDPALEVAAEDAVESVTEVNWRSFNCKITDNHLTKLMQDAKLVDEYASAAEFDNHSLNWQEALAFQRNRMSHMDDDDNDENEQILLAYIKYQAIFISVLRENSLFNDLWMQWTRLGTSVSTRLVKSKELERIVNNLQKYLHDIAELPGVYSDDQLLSEFELYKVYLLSYLNAGCLAHMYRANGQYLEALALYVDAYKILDAKIAEIENWDSLVLPESLLSKDLIDELLAMIKTDISSVIALAEYEKELQGKLATGKRAKYQRTVIEKIDHDCISVTDARIKNLFPLRPILRPAGAKATLFDLAFNYINYAEETVTTTSLEDEGSEPHRAGVDASEEIEVDEKPQPTGKKRGFLGLFGR
ncbi:signal recognition particle subunit SRP68 KNAG_0D00780 [Huiozyma naganishii CBS 8797]|uniref:Signal recognition particle subunit SRP68 n=1 Tax=Huiozyma naganishii (strain ATCC MYA-139 / BCRC 22969 / CBS 8797 / KCTC 17520 / NBRC 10181 / NCYC 3082 / Yp74L-3) TaxID=1071383 RepID=J7R4Q9_HUIN7|nr:hypothetical protein KNAG_0D00780 [Kazachstania naganishii CBS 8797]CCK69830.1 hypothetical protein KNAG_0D00780 [Kazachstania naganishii CBS 8797]